MRVTAVRLFLFFADMTFDLRLAFQKTFQLKHVFVNVC
jgi:hypothetical protein